MWAWGRMVPRGRSGRGLVASVRVAVRVCVGGPSDGMCVGLAIGPTGGLWCDWGSRVGLVGAAGRWSRVDASGAVWGCGPGLLAVPGPGPVCGRMVPRGCLGRAPVVAVFNYLGMFSLLAGDAWCSRVAVAVWCCGGCRCAVGLAARSCRRLCGVPAPSGAGAPVVLVAAAVCGRCGDWAVARGVQVDGLDDVEVVGLYGAPVPDGDGGRTLVAPVAAVLRCRGWVAIVVTFRSELEELWRGHPKPSSGPLPHCRTCRAAVVGRVVGGYDAPLARVCERRVTPPR